MRLYWQNNKGRFGGSVIALILRPGARYFSVEYRRASMLIESQPAVRLPVGASPVQACRPARSRSSHCLNAPTRPESHMLDWLTWPADQLLRIGGVVAGWFFSRDE